MAQRPVPINGLGSVGIITDIEPYDLPLNAWSMGNNVRFQNGAVQRAPVFREVEGTITPTTPAFAVGVRPASGNDFLVYVENDGSIYKWSSGTETDITPPTFTPSVTQLPFTSCKAGEVVYLNHPEVHPHYLPVGGATFTNLPGWTSTWKCRALREFKDHLLALNVTKGATAYPNMIKTSDTITTDAAPGSWDETDLTTNATEVQLAGVPNIVDGLTLGNAFIIYSEYEVWRRQLVGGRYIWDDQKAFRGPGCISQNCVVEIQGYHYVFGNDDLYRHNGQSWESLADGRVRKYVFENLTLSDSAKCFVALNASLSEVWFCYPSADTQVNFPGTAYANKAAIYNYANNTWSFMDLPNVSSYGIANVNAVLTYDTTGGATYDNIGGSYFNQEAAAELHLVFTSVADTGNGITASKLLGSDLADRGTLSYDINTETEVPAYVERVGLDLDEMDPDPALYKVVRGIYPKLRTFLNATMGVEIGAGDLAEDTPTYQTSQTFDPATDYKLDFMAAGRYLAMKFTMSTHNDFKLGSVALDLNTIGRR